ncbi:PIN domain-containing protein [Candidatus Woesearchaeota archaeon]|nr:PIN domain-containing protein [Candidatus Woesearchaeota archaeon]
MAVFDTFALVKLLKKEKGYEAVTEMLLCKGIISEATLYELTYVTVRDLLAQGFSLNESIHKASEIISSISEYLHREVLSDRIMHYAVYFKIKYNKLNLSHFDCIALATAKVFSQPLVSGEKGLAQVKEVKVVG